MNGVVILAGAGVGLLLLTMMSGSKKKTVVKSPGWPTIKPLFPPEPPNIVTVPPIVFPPVGLPSPANETPPVTTGLPSPANETPPTGLPTPAAPPKTPAKPVASNVAPLTKSQELAKLIPAYELSMGSLDERAAIANPARNQIVSLIQTQWNEPLFLGTLTPSDIGEALSIQGYSQLNKSPLVQQVWRIFNAVVGDAMRDQYITNDVKAGKQPLTIGKQYMVTSPGNITGTSERRYRALAGL